MTLDEAVFDASAVVRGLTTEGDAAELFDQVATGTTVAQAPDLIVAEVASALTQAARAEIRSLDDARSLLALVAAAPIELHPGTALAPAAIELAVTSNLSAYDAFYAVLARALELPLVTADRRLAAVVPGSMLID